MSLTLPKNLPPEVVQKLNAHADLTVQIFCQQISRDYLTFIKRNVLKGLPEYKPVNLNELKIVLLIDGSRNGQLKSTDIANVYRVDAATVGRGVAALRSKGMILLSDDPEDSRTKILTLTDTGTALANAYLAKCLEALATANERLGFENRDEFVNKGHMAFNQVKDRAAALRRINFKKTQSFRLGMGQSGPKHELPEEVLYLNADILFQVYAEQSSNDYLLFIRKHVIPELARDRKLPLRALHVVLAMEFYSRPVTAGDIADVLRLEPATVSRAISKLREVGLAETSDSLTDARTKLLNLTDTGRDFANDFKSIMSEKIKAAEDHYGIQWETETRANIIGILSMIKARSSALAELPLRGRRKRTAIIRDFSSMHNFQDYDLPARITR